jgi:hypothetical protein
VQIPPNHPYWYVRHFVENTPTVSTLWLSYYFYVPQSISDTRDIFQVSREEFLSPFFISEVIRSTPTNRELALHSRVATYFDHDLHIPMVDMATGARAQLSKLQSVIEQAGFKEFSWFTSGRSFHGYGAELLTHEYWIKLMGALLLSNQIGMPPIVDPRWIGHRLMAGYSALRWTNNTSHYLDTPTYLPTVGHPKF